MQSGADEKQMPSRNERLEEFFRRMLEAPASSSFDEAYQKFCSTLDQVEDELTGLPNEPSQWKTIPRNFPPQKDRMSSIQGSDVKRFENRRHRTYIAPNGAIEVRTIGSVVAHLSIAGSDGRTVCDLCPELVDKMI